jgi:hypothetical protein
VNGANILYHEIAEKLIVITSEFNPAEIRLSVESYLNSEGPLLIQPSPLSIPSNPQLSSIYANLVRKREIAEYLFRLMRL